MPLTKVVPFPLSRLSWLDLKQRYDWRRPPALAVTIILSEFGDFFMMRRMLYGIRRRAENGATRDLARDTPRR